MFDIWDVQGRAIPYTLRLPKPRKDLAKAESAAALDAVSAHTPRAYQALHSYADVRDAEPSMVRPVARDWMRHPVLTVQRHASIGAALDLLKMHDVRCLPVLPASSHVPIGMLSDREVLQFLTSHSADEARHYPVEAVMRTDVLSARPETTIHRIAHVMVQEHLFAMPVVDPEQGLIGLLSRGDILRLVVELTATHLPTL